MVEALLKMTTLLRENNYQAALDMALDLQATMQGNPYLLRLIAGLYGALAGSATLGGWELEEEAIRWGERAAQAAPRIGWLWADLGWAYELHLDHEQAHRAFRAALARDSCCVQALRGLASLYNLPENEGQCWVTQGEMIACLKQVVELEHQDPASAIHWLVYELRAMGRYEEARDYVVRALSHLRPPEPGAMREFEAILRETRIG